MWRRREAEDWRRQRETHNSRYSIGSALGSLLRCCKESVEMPPQRESGESNRNGWRLRVSGKSVARCVDGEKSAVVGERMKSIWQSRYGVCKCVALRLWGLIARAEARKPGKAAKKSVHGLTERQLERQRVRGGETTGEEGGGRRESEKSAKRGQKSCA